MVLEGLGENFGKGQYSAGLAREAAYFQPGNRVPMNYGSSLTPTFGGVGNAYDRRAAQLVNGLDIYNPSENPYTFYSAGMHYSLSETPGPGYYNGAAMQVHGLGETPGRGYFSRHQFKPTPLEGLGSLTSTLTSTPVLIGAGLLVGGGIGLLLWKRKKRR